MFHNTSILRAGERMNEENDYEEAFPFAFELPKGSKMGENFYTCDTSGTYIGATVSDRDNNKLFTVYLQYGQIGNPMLITYLAVGWVKVPITFEQAHTLINDIRWQLT